MLICTLWVIIVYRSTVVIFLTSDSRNKKCGTRYLIIWILKDICFFCYPVTFLNNCRCQNVQFYRYLFVFNNIIYNKQICDTTGKEKKIFKLAPVRHHFIYRTGTVHYAIYFISLSRSI